jgi:hypothetical protein
MPTSTRPALTAGLITRALFSVANRRWTSTRLADGTVRTSPRVTDGDLQATILGLLDSAQARLTAQGWTVHRSGYALTVTDPIQKEN